MNNTEWQYLEKKHSENNEILKNHPLILHVPYMPDESLNSWATIDIDKRGKI